jgi:hypothetical protein
MLVSTDSKCQNKLVLVASKIQLLCLSKNKKHKKDHCNCDKIDG